MKHLTKEALNELYNLIETCSEVDEDGIINLGNLIEIKPIEHETEEGWTVTEGYDLYKYASQEDMEDDDYDFDADFITSVYFDTPQREN